VLASLWSVGDESTKELMVEFYRQLAAGQSKAAALQSAEIKLLKNPKFARPLYWAPFVLMGDWR
jgi:CHAT domain-containing protein